MNRLMIALGILLIAGLSFAFVTPPGTWQYPWQSYVYDRYECNMEFFGEGKYILANYMYAYSQPYVSYSLLDQLDLLGGNMYDHLEGMYYSYYATPFRTEMAGYNTDSTAFNAVFNSILRIYLQHGGSNTYVANWFNMLNVYYYACITGGPVPL